MRWASEQSTHGADVSVPVASQWKVSVAFGCALVCLCAIAAVSYWSLSSQRDALAWVDHTHQVLDSLNSLTESLAEAEAAQRAFVIGGEESYFITFQRETSQSIADLRRSQRLVSDNAEQAARSAELASLIAERLTYLDNAAAMRRTGGLPALQPLIAAGRGRAMHDAIAILTDAMKAVESQLLLSRQEKVKRSTTTAQAVILGGGVFAWLVVGLALLSLRRDEAVRSHAESMIRNANTNLELRVQARTMELTASTQRLAQEMATRRSAQERLQAQLQRLSLLQRITQAVGERLDLDAVFAVVVETLEVELPVDFCCILIHDKAHGRMTMQCLGPRSTTLADAMLYISGGQIDVGENGLARCLQGHLVYEQELSEVPFPFSQRLARAGLSALVIAPLQVESTVYGVLLCGRVDARSFSSGECEFLNQLSAHVALAGRQLQLYDALQAAYDDNRRTQHALMDQERLRSLGQMASGIAHDINNAISPVSMYADILLREPTMNERCRDYLETIRRAIGDVGQTVGRLRDFSRHREDQVVKSPVQLNELVRQVISLTEARWSDMAEEQGLLIDVRVDLADGLPPILGVASELRDALVNLIFNAVDAMPAGGILTLRTYILNEGMFKDGATIQRVCLEIADTGIGMDVETRRRCLEPFFTTKGAQGTGLGLAMVYGTMQRHGSEVEIETEVGRGTTMRFSFPVPVQESSAPVDGVQQQLPLLHILVIDDDILVSRAVCQRLELDGHRVTSAEGGRAGIVAFRDAQRRNDEYDVVITDLGMPHTDGRAVANAVKSMKSSCVVMLLTGWGQRLSSEHSVPANVDCVLSKPPSGSQLDAALARCLSARAALT